MVEIIQDLLSMYVCSHTIFIIKSDVSINLSVVDVMVALVCLFV